MGSVVENRFIRLWIEEGILHAYYKPVAVIGIDEARELVKLRLRVQNNMPYKILCHYSNMGLISPEAKEYFATAESCACMIKVALLTEDFFMHVTGELYVTNYQPPVPTRLFQNKEEALCWLKEEP